MKCKKNGRIHKKDAEDTNRIFKTPKLMKNQQRLTNI